MIVTCVYVNVRKDSIREFIDLTALNHKSTPHYIKWRDSVADLMEESRYGVRYNIIEPADRKEW